MTREEAIARVKHQRDWANEVNRMLDVEAFDMGIKALEQEPTLDKIRARIELEKLGYPPSAGYYKAIMKCLQIIDKYKPESEVEE